MPTGRLSWQTEGLGPNPKPMVKPNNNSNQTLNQTGNMSSNQIQATQIQQQAKPMNVSGK
jgi:hypothetical protein